MNGGTGNGILDKTFVTRGNHDGSDTAGWVSRFNITSIASRVGAINLSQLNTNLTYSFDYQNAHFAGVDLPEGDVDSMAATQLIWLDQDLTAAEDRGLTHAFLFWHGPEYPIGSHCCNSYPALTQMLDRHAILSATFHGHEHSVAYVHMDSSRYSNITHPYEQFISGDAGAGPDGVNSGRYDWWLGDYHGFMTIDVDGNTFYRQCI